ncbi:GTP cyclohydrolase II [Bradyrhizobium sp. YR681]|uniref:GTP cyclohydrolase II n=1 Tax=Bradyrhizobium sp. YR681 TaxID=1144344 RepID=UPI00026F74B3|nr:GTP cyclohydrolase II [Bradyrhizobium sp. YR681]EJN08246.1 GTP cyclohydrolase II [Bradyrhizobium sp. YR681]
MRDIRLGNPIRLTTKHGYFFLRHIGVGETARISLKPDPAVDRTDIAKEGVVLSRSLNPKDDTSPFRVRVQSSCLFSESFWATDCDCAGQLALALDLIQTSGGILIYLYEEGRGIGLRRKIEAIRLQQIEGKTSSGAFACLGLGPDARDYEVSASVIRQILGEQAEIELLSNNGYKERQLRDYGVNIVKRNRLIPSELSSLQKAYLASKRDDLGHDIPNDVIAPESNGKDPENADRED